MRSRSSTDASKPSRPLVALVSADAELAYALAQRLEPFDIDVKCGAEPGFVFERLAELDLIVVESDELRDGVRRFLIELRRACAPREPLPVLLVGEDVPAFVKMLSFVRATLARPVETALVGAIREALARTRPPRAHRLPASL